MDLNSSTLLGRITGRLVAVLEGLGISAGDNVPGCWLAGLGVLLRSHGTFAGVLLGVQVEEGVVYLRLDQHLDYEPERFRWHQLANRWVYPNLWRPAKRVHWRRLWAQRRELHAELESMPQVRALAKAGPAMGRKEAP